jgi:starvation-inducible DNA-binding protein
VSLVAWGRFARFVAYTGQLNGFVEPSDMLAELREDNQSLAAWLREVHNVCEEHRDLGTASLLAEETRRNTDEPPRGDTQSVPMLLQFQ